MPSKAPIRKGSRKKTKPTAADLLIEKALKKTVDLDLIEIPMRDVVDYLKELHGVNFVLDDENLADVPVTSNLKGISLRSVLNIVLRKHDLAFVVQDESIIFTKPSVVAGQNSAASKDAKNAKPTAAEQHIQEMLAKPTKLQFIDLPLGEMVGYLEDLYKVNGILEDESSANKLINIDVKDVTLRSALNIMLRPHGLVYVRRERIDYHRQAKGKTKIVNDRIETDYRRDGVVRVRSLFAAEELSEIRSALQRYQRELLPSLPTSDYTLEADGNTVRNLLAVATSRSVFPTACRAARTAAIGRAVVGWRVRSDGGSRHLTSRPAWGAAFHCIKTTPISA